MITTRLEALEFLQKQAEAAIPKIAAHYAKRVAESMALRGETFDPADEDDQHHCREVARQQAVEASAYRRGGWTDANYTALHVAVANAVYETMISPHTDAGA